MTLKSVTDDPALGSEYFETVIIGGGQAGLSVGYHLKKQGRPFVILDANERIGDAWRKRWDSLRLFTPARYDGLAGWRFPAPALSFPTKDEMADYLESYAARFDLPVRTGVKVDALSREADRFVVAVRQAAFRSGPRGRGYGRQPESQGPAFADELDPSIVQLHSSQYRNPSQLQEGGVLVVGVGNSGAEIAFEVSRTHRPSSLASPGQDPCPSRTASGSVILSRDTVCRQPRADVEYAHRAEGSTQVHLPWRAARRGEAEGHRSRRSRAGAEDRRRERAACRCSRTEESLRWRT